MDTEAALMKFVTNAINHNPDDNGQKYNQDQVNLVETFKYLVDNLKNLFKVIITPNI